MFDHYFYQKMLAFIISGPSGCGKSTLLRKLFQRFPGKFSFTVSHTTRAPRNNEINGKDYYFINVEQFEEMIKNDEFIEFARFANNYYGTSFKALQTQDNVIPVLDIDLQGVKLLKKAAIDAKYLLLLPLSLKHLEKQLRQRASETEEQIEQRIKQAKIDLELLEKDKYLFDGIIINDDLDDSFQQIVNFVKKHFNVY